MALAWPGQTLRVIGSLGPLQGMGVTGSLTWEFEKAPEGTTVTQTYVVGGFPTMPFLRKKTPALRDADAQHLEILSAETTWCSICGIRRQT